MTTHVVLEIVSLHRKNQAIGVCREEDSTVAIRRLDMIVMDLVHECFGNIQYCHVDICRFV